MNKTLWFRAIREATSRHRHPTKRQALEVAKELFPTELELSAKAAADRGHLRDLSDAMRCLAGPEEGDDAQTDQGDLLRLLPGEAPPAYLMVPDGGKELSVVKYRRAVRPERRFAIEERRVIAKRIAKRAEDLEKKDEFLDPFTGGDGVTVEDALRLLASQRQAAE